MQVGTQILIDRMKTNPEEFQEGKISRWGKALSMANEWLPEDDKKALNEAINNMRLENFNEEVLKTLADEAEKEPPLETLKYKSTGRYGGGWTDPAGIFGNSATGLIAQEIGSLNTSPKMVMQANGDVSIDGNLTVKGKIHADRS